jgi:hypothetical protein
LEIIAVGILATTSGWPYVISFTGSQGFIPFSTKKVMCQCDSLMAVKKEVAWQALGKSMISKSIKTGSCFCRVLCYGSLRVD